MARGGFAAVLMWGLSGGALAESQPVESGGPTALSVAIRQMGCTPYSEKGSSAYFQRNWRERFSEGTERAWLKKKFETLSVAHWIGTCESGNPLKFSMETFADEEQAARRVKAQRLRVPGMHDKSDPFLTDYFQRGVQVGTRVYFVSIYGFNDIDRLPKPVARLLSAQSSAPKPKVPVSAGLRAPLDAVPAMGKRKKPEARSCSHRQGRTSRPAVAPTSFSQPPARAR